MEAPQPFQVVRQGVHGACEGLCRRFTPIIQGLEARLPGFEQCRNLILVEQLQLAIAHSEPGVFIE